MTNEELCELLKKDLEDNGIRDVVIQTNQNLLHNSKYVFRLTDGPKYTKLVPEHRTF